MRMDPPPCGSVLILAAGPASREVYVQSVPAARVADDTPCRTHGFRSGGASGRRYYRVGREEFARTNRWRCRELNVGRYPITG